MHHSLIHHCLRLSHFISDSPRLYQTYLNSISYLLLLESETTLSIAEALICRLNEDYLLNRFESFFMSIFAIRIKILSKIHAIFGSLCYHLFKVFKKFQKFNDGYNWKTTETKYTSNMIINTIGAKKKSYLWIVKQKPNSVFFLSQNGTDTTGDNTFLWYFELWSDTKYINVKKHEENMNWPICLCHEDNANGFL